MVEWNIDRFEIDAETRVRLRKLNENFDAELLKMEAWYLANPKKRKKNHFRFMVNWLNHAQKKVTIIKDYKLQNEEFKENLKKAEEEAAPPPQEWREMMQKLKYGAA